MFLFPLFSLLFVLLTFAASPALARQTLLTTTPDGRPFLLFDIYDKGEVFGSEKFAEGDQEALNQASTWTFQQPELKALQNAADYWSALVGGHTRNSAPMRITLGTYDDDNADAMSQFPDGSPYTELADGLINGRMTVGEVSAQVRAGYSMGAPHRDYMGFIEVLPHNGDASHEANALTHELGHAMGMISHADQEAAQFRSTLSVWDQHLYDQNGNPARPDQPIVFSGASPTGFVLDIDRKAFFKGPHVSEVLNGAMLDPYGLVADAIPINGWEGDVGDGTQFPELSHPELARSMMSHQGYRNWVGYMEGELAILQDLGYAIDRKNFYGFSVYASNQTLINTNGYFARNADGTAYLPGRYNAAMMGVGLHIYGSNNTVTQRADILSVGYGGAGIRVDGERGGNSLTIDPGVRVHANGEHGTALMVAYGANHTVTQRGELAALGSGGVGARFDFGSNVLGNLAAGYEGSYISMEDGQTLGELPGKLAGPLVSRFDLTGPIAGAGAAVYISDLAYVKEINIMRGASLSGNVISHWNPTDPRVQYQGDPADLMTDLRLGVLPDANGRATGADDPAFSLAYSGRIYGPDSLKLDMRAGTLTFGGQADVASFVLRPAAGLRVGVQSSAASISADDITLAPGSTVEFLKPEAFSYGPKLEKHPTVLGLHAANRLDNRSRLIANVPPGRFSMGVYDYEYDKPYWARDGSLKLAAVRSFSHERAGTAAVAAPLALAARNPVPGLLFERMKRAFAGHAGTGSSGGNSGPDGVSGTGGSSGNGGKGEGNRSGWTGGNDGSGWTGGNDGSGWTGTGVPRSVFARQAGGSGAGFVPAGLAVLAGLPPVSPSRATEARVVDLSDDANAAPRSTRLLDGRPVSGEQMISNLRDGGALPGGLVSGGISNGMSGGMSGGGSLDSSAPLWRSFLNGGGEARAGASSVWMTPSYTYASQSGERSYDVQYPALTLGYDRWVTDRLFLGLAVSGALPAYRSGDADVDGTTLTAALYGGAILPLDLELGAFMLYANTSHDQTREALDHRYTSDYNAESFSVGLSLGRSFALSEAVGLRPFVSYEYLNLHTDSHDEGDGAYALRFGSGNNELHRVQAGADLGFAFADNAFVSGRAYYSGLYGDRRGVAEAAFTQDPGSPQKTENKAR